MAITAEGIPIEKWAVEGPSPHSAARARRERRDFAQGDGPGDFRALRAVAISGRGDQRKMVV